MISSTVTISIPTLSWPTLEPLFVEGFEKGSAQETEIYVR
jgi:hypothetical protein